MGVWNWLFGGVVEQGAKVATAAVEASADKAEAEAGDNESARAFAAPGSALEHPGAINQLVDAANRLIRPASSTFVLGGLAGWWPLPDLQPIDPRWIAAGGIILTFWFGGRALLKDLPGGIASALALWAKFKGR